MRLMFRGLNPSVSPAASHLPCKGRPMRNAGRRSLRVAGGLRFMRFFADDKRSFAFTPQKHSRSAHCRSHYSLFLHLSAASSQASYHSHPCCVMFCLHERSFTALLLLPPKSLADFSGTPITVHRTRFGASPQDDRGFRINCN